MLNIFEKKEWKQITDILWEFTPKHSDEPKLRVNTVTEKIFIEDKTKKSFIPINCKDALHPLMQAEQTPTLSFSIELALLRKIVHQVLNTPHIEEEEHHTLDHRTLEEIEQGLLKWWNRNADKPHRYYKSELIFTLQLTLSKIPQKIKMVLDDEGEDEQSGPSTAAGEVSLIKHGMINWTEIKAIQLPQIKNAAINAAVILRDVAGLK